MTYVQEKITELKKGLSTAFIDQTMYSNLAYRPEFVSNNYRQGKKVLVSIEEELAKCEEFRISVAFITKSGITPFLQTLKELEEKNIPGKILTTDYLMFSEPEALEKLSALKNITLKMFRTTEETGGFHTKWIYFPQRGNVSNYHWKLKYDSQCHHKKQRVEYKDCVNGTRRDGTAYSCGIR